MGLDMYLSRRTYVKNWDFMKPEERHEVSVKLNNIPVSNIDVNKISYVIEEVGYWRKANAIHNWFVENVQEGDDDCKEYWVSRENLETLLSECKEVIKNPTVSEEKLPTKSGFFFGSYEYDEYYIQDIKRTINIIEDVLKTTDFSYQDIYYTSSW